MSAERRPAGAREDFLALASVQAHLRTALEFVADRADVLLRDEVDCYFAEQIHESPIEAVFAIWWIALDERWGGPGDYLALRAQESVRCGDATYRLDFTVVFTDADTLCDARRFNIPVQGIAVELDGHEFHERTKEQVERRNQRDRDLQTAGWKVFHFAGSEVMRDPKHCVEEVRHYAARHVQMLWGLCYERKKQQPS